MADALKSYLLARGHKEVAISPVPPEDEWPDFFCDVNGERWAVEVTHSNQRISAGRASKARIEIDKPLLAFGENLGKKTESLRCGGYLLILRWPLRNTPWKKWRNQITENVVEFIQSRQKGERKLSDLCSSTIQTIETDARWTVAIAPSDNVMSPSGAMLCDIAANIFEMIEYAIADKAVKTSPAKGNTKNVLFLINTYFLGDDPLEVGKCVSEIVLDRPEWDIFDHVFYQDDHQIDLVYSRSKHEACEIHEETK